MNWSADTSTHWPEELSRIADQLRYAGINRIDSVAWRDLADPDAGGSEVHADEVMRRWAMVGLDIHHRTSTNDSPEHLTRNGYRVTRSGGRYSVFPRVITSRMLRRARSDIATVEIWNGVPWFSQLWGHKARAVWLHHIHEDMWKESVPGPLAPIARFIEVRVAPLFYRRTHIATLATTTRDVLVSRGFKPERVWVAEPGIDPRYRPMPQAKTPRPTLLAVGRLAPVKRFGELIEQFAHIARQHPDARLTIAGDGPERDQLRSVVSALGLEDHVHLPGRVSDEELLHLYQSSWLLVSASHSEGWGMTITEAAACGTPCVVTRNHGHEAAAVDGVTGIIVDDVDDMAPVINSLLGDADQLGRLSAGAEQHAARYTWDRTAALLLWMLKTSIDPK